MFLIKFWYVVNLIRITLICDSWPLINERCSINNLLWLNNVSIKLYSGLFALYVVFICCHCMCDKFVNKLSDTG